MCFEHASRPRIAPLVFFFFNDTATTEIYTLSLHDALPISYTRPEHVPRSLLRCLGGNYSSACNQGEETTQEFASSRSHSSCSWCDHFLISPVWARHYR